MDVLPDLIIGDARLGEHVFRALRDLRDRKWPPRDGSSNGESSSSMRLGVRDSESQREDRGLIG